MHTHTYRHVTHVCTTHMHTLIHTHVHAQHAHITHACTHGHTCMQINTYTCMCTPKQYTHANTYNTMHTRTTHVCTHKHTVIHMHTHMHNHTHTYRVHTCTHLYAHIGTLMHSHAHTPTHSCTYLHLRPHHRLQLRPLRETVGSPCVTVTASAPSSFLAHFGFWQLGWYFSNHFCFLLNQEKKMFLSLFSMLFLPPISSAKMHSKKRKYNCIQLAMEIINRSKRFNPFYK